MTIWFVVKNLLVGAAIGVPIGLGISYFLGVFP